MPLSQPALLVVDDCPEFYEMVACRFGVMGYRVLVADGAQSALQALTDERPDVAVVDLMFPSKSGFAVVEALARLGVPVVVVAAHATQADWVRLKGSGVGTLLTIPYQLEELEQAVTKLCPLAHENG